MIRYALKCAEGHGFESWFASGEAYEKLARAGHLSCPVCGAAQVEKALMAPAVAAAAAVILDAHDARGPAPAETEEAALTRKIEALRREVEENSDYVGPEFARTARAMHLGEEPERPIHGEARIDDARALLAEGIAVTPLPFIPRARSN
jgi:hypothetical protein